MEEKYGCKIRARKTRYRQLKSTTYDVVPENQDWKGFAMRK
jgi:hypothetical protein